MKSLFQSLMMLVLLTILTGVVYPSVVTLIGQMTFPESANGSILVCHDKPVGSQLIAQKFTGGGYFWPRPSAADYNAMASNASQLGPTSSELVQQYTFRKQSLIETNPDGGVPPDDMLATSASGLDPEISPEAALFQVARVAKNRNYTEEQKKNLVDETRKRIDAATLGFLGADRINVLTLNMQLDGCR